MLGAAHAASFSYIAAALAATPVPLQRRTDRVRERGPMATPLGVISFGMGITANPEAEHGEVDRHSTVSAWMCFEVPGAGFARGQTGATSPRPSWHLPLLAR